MAVITMKQLLESGVHFGHQTRRWNPKMSQYIYTKRNGIHIIDLQKTVSYIEDAYKRFLEIGKDGGKVLFVGTKKQAIDSVKAEATRAGHFYVTKRWLGGTLTNFKTIRKSIRRLHTIRKWETDGTFERLPNKKEVIELKKELARLEMFLGGIEEMRTLPDAVFVVDTRKEQNAVREARKLGIPVFAMVDTNCDPDEVDHIIPANDDAIRSIKLIVGKMAEALMEGAGGASKEEAKEAAESEQKEKATPAQKEAAKKTVKTSPDKAKSEKREEKPEPKKKAEPKKDKPAVKKEEAPKAAPKKEAPKKEKPKTEEKQEKPAKAEDLESLTVPELKQLAKEKGLSGYSKLRKAELIEALKK